MSRRFGTPPDCVVRRHVDEVEAARRVVVVVVVVVMVDASSASRILIVNTRVTVSLRFQQDLCPSKQDVDDLGLSSS